MVVSVSIVIPVFNKVAFTKQCLERLGRDTSVPFEVVIVDNGSTDGTQDFFESGPDLGFPLIYIRNEGNLGFSRGNNVGAARSSAPLLLFLNNDTLATDGWLRAMVSAAEQDARVGVVGIKQLFPYTNRIHHTGIVFDADRRPQHLYPHADASEPRVNKQREYQAVTGSCLMISRELFDACGGFDEGYRNGYEDVDLCLRVRQRGRSVACCTSGYIYHYGQISDTRTDDDDQNAARLADRWRDVIEIDDIKYAHADRHDADGAPRVRRSSPAPNIDRECLYFADDLSAPSALTWVTADLIQALVRRDRPVALRRAALPASASPSTRALLERRMIDRPPVGGVQIRWSHYWPQHLYLDLAGRLNLELFVINYLFDKPGSQPWDYWLQCLAQNGYRKLPLATFNLDVLRQIGVDPADCAVIRPGYSDEVHRVDPPRRRDSRVRLLTVTNSHDLERYGTHALLDAYWATFQRRDDVVLVVKDYGASSGDTTLRDRLHEGRDRAAVEYISEFTTKEKLIELYKSCDAFVSAHRGEGYGMKILDALACGVPVVTPLFGGPTDFCNATNCFPVDHTLIPVGDCFDTRSLHITNRPVWAEPDRVSLSRQLRRVVEDRDTARRIGERARQDVIDTLTWDEAARHLDEFIAAQSARQDSDLRVVPTGSPKTALSESSPYWLGCRVSVVVPTYNRSRMLRKCLEALARQTVLPQEMEVIVVDDGSTDDTQALVESIQTPYALKYVRQANAGPGTARNTGLMHATGELILFIGDDIVADERLLESHLAAHATKDVSTAVLGHIDWPADMPKTPVMDFVCGPSTLQFAYAFIPTLPALDFRFFYTSNISLKRQFLVEAANDGVRFDPDFTDAAFEDSEFAVRLERRGLEIVYCAEARVDHEHWMDIDSFSRRERSVGRMAAVFYRKHPSIDSQIQIRWVGDWADAVDVVMSRPDMQARLVELDERSRTVLRRLADALEARGEHATPYLHAALAGIFDVERTAGKVEGWYSAVKDRTAIDTATRLICGARRLELLTGSPLSAGRGDAQLAWLEPDALSTLHARVDRIDELITTAPEAVVLYTPTPQTHDTDAGIGAHADIGQPPSMSVTFRRRVGAIVRRADLHVQHRLGTWGSGRWLSDYRRMRSRLVPLLRRRGRIR